MKYEYQKLLLEFARLQLQIAIARCPTAAMDVTHEHVHRSAGYRKLREFFVHLSPKKRNLFAREMRQQIDGIREVMKRAEAAGERVSMADVVIEIRDKETGEAIGAMPVDEATSECRSSGAGLPGVEIDGNGHPYVKCPSCLARWSAHDIGFNLPRHETVYT